jgi:hypothetical protein
VRGRAQNARLQHPRQPDVARVARLAGHLFQGVLAAWRATDHAERCGRFEGRFLQTALDALALDQLTIADASAGRGIAHNAVRHLKFLGRNLEAFRG